MRPELSRLVGFVHREPEPDVLQVTNVWPEPDRPVYGIFVQRQVESLREAGVRCDVLYIRGYASGFAYPVAAAWFLLSTLLWRGRYRLIHAHSGEAGLAARFHLGAPVIVSYFGDDVLGDRDAGGGLTRAARVRSAIVRAHSRLFAATITKSRVMESALPPRTRRKNHVVPNGVRRDLFRPVEREAARKRLGWDDGPVALFAATKPHSEAKRLGLARRACELAGVRLELADQVAPDRMPLLMSAADCLLVTSAVEGSPNVVKEALMCNLPVVATGVGDIPERLDGVTPSWICPPDEAAFAAALREVAAERPRSNGRESAADLDELRVAERLVGLYTRLGARRGRAAVTSLREGPAE
jgi:teichuronic acid biosynthesis glycosyltransferase TuaC